MANFLYSERELVTMGRPSRMLVRVRFVNADGKQYTGTLVSICEMLTQEHPACGLVDVRTHPDARPPRHTRTMVPITSVVGVEL